MSVQPFDPPFRHLLNLVADFQCQRQGSQMVVDMIESGKMDQFHRERGRRLQMHRGFVIALDQAIANTKTHLPECCQP